MAPKKQSKSATFHMVVDGEALKTVLPEILNEASLNPLTQILFQEKDREQVAWKVLELDASGARSLEPSALLGLEGLRRRLAADGRSLRIVNNPAAMTRLLRFFGFATAHPVS